MSNFMDYIRGGEFLVAPSLDYKHHYILKCCGCDEFYNDMGALYYHCLNHYNYKSTDDDHGSVDKVKNDDKQTNDNKISTIKCENFLEAEEEALNEWHCVEDDEFNSEFQDKDGIISVEYITVQKCRDIPAESDSDTMESKCEISFEKSTKSGLFVRDFMKTKLNVTALIDAYKRQPRLWDTSISSIKYEERNAIFDEIAHDLKTCVNLELSCDQVAAVIGHMHRTYRKKMKSKQHKGQHASIWYFEHLEFLKPFIQAKFLSAEIQSETDIDRYLPDMPQELLSNILEVYKKHPILWNTEMAENYCENKRNESFEEMLNCIKSEKNLQIDRNKLKKYVESIHSCVPKLKYNIPKDQTVTTECYTQMNFLFDHVGPFLCSECGRRPKSALALRVHHSKHDGSIPLICSICKKGFNVISTYISHVRRHNEDLQSECLECGKKFLRPYDLEIHMRCHTGVKPFCCELCGISFRHIQTFASHKRKHDQNFLHKCPICAKGFYAKAKLNDHVRTHTDIRDFACETCGKAFKTKKTLTQHQVIHKDARNHACPVCGKTFKLKVGVNQHMRSHGRSIGIPSMS